MKEYAKIGIDRLIEILKQLHDVEVKAINMNKNYAKLCEENVMLQRLIVELSIDKWNLDRYNIEELLDFDSPKCGVQNVKDLLLAKVSADLIRTIIFEKKKGSQNDDK